ncbi:MAG: RNA methyltransferase [Bacteroidetes bacterium]|nr:MAG: RNA methyltransferase [Bacteroidota bacterium]
MTPERKRKFERVARYRQPNLTVVLENVHDPHNIGAVLRTCDSVGVREVYVLYTEPQLTEERIVLGKRTAAGALKWVDVHLFTDLHACFRTVKQRYGTILSTHLGQQSTDLYDLDLTRSVALLFGNEHAGLSPEALTYVDGNFKIPQVGMVESLNISVACAVTLYEAFRQRRAKGWFGEQPLLPPEEQRAQLEEYLRRHDQRVPRKILHPGKK